MGESEPGATMCTAPLKWTRMKTSAQAGLLDVIRVLKGTSRGSSQCVQGHWPSEWIGGLDA
jgi:hypothetical protein